MMEAKQKPRIAIGRVSLKGPLTQSTKPWAAGTVHIVLPLSD
jgi:hypothetical protein